ncbi:MAG: motility protein A [Alphaproteobacteria bacterium]
MGHKNSIDLSTVIGILSTFIIIGFAISSSKNNLSAFIDLHSILIVIGGTFLVTSACFSIGEIFSAHKIIFDMIIFKQSSIKIIAIEALKNAEYARKHGVIALENKLLKGNKDIILKKGIILINQAVTLDNIEKILTQEINTLIEENNNVVSILRKSAEIAPAMGLIGTLIGLVQMLGNLSDPSKLGPSMAIALLTTFYGAVLAYVLFFPMASKIERNSRDQIIIAQISMKTILSISKGENPRYLENNINSLLSQFEKINYYANS